MDEWLDSQGLYRKNTALDGTCLFRAVAEQLFTYHVPKGHIILREQCIKFMRKNRNLFEGKVISGPFDEYLDNLSDLKQWAGQLELEALSLIYGVDFLVFKSVDLEPIQATQNGFEKKIMLCFTPDNFYDAVYPKSYIVNAGFCQSIVYGILYRGVFKLEDLEYAVEKMLHDKSARAQREKYLNSQSQCREDCYDFYLEDSEGPINMKELLDMGAILFPYKVAKALDPDIYRNIDFDNWVDTLRVPRKNSFWFGNGGPLRVGVKCLLKLEDKCYNAHVQEMSADCGPALVFVEELGEKYVQGNWNVSMNRGMSVVCQSNCTFKTGNTARLTVPFESLEPLPRTSLKPEWTYSHKHQIINKLNLNKNSGNNGNDDSMNKGKARNKNRKIKDSVKYGTGDRKRDNSERPMNLDYVDEGRSGVTSSGGSGMGDGIQMSGDSTKSENCNGVIIAEPDSTSQNYNHLNVTISSPQTAFGNNMILTPCGWPSPCRAPPQPHIVKAVNLMVNKSVKHDCSDLPLTDLETIRFFFNLGIDYFRMGCLVWPGPPSDDTYSIQDPNRPFTKPLEDSNAKSKVFKSQQKPPRFMKMETPELKPTSEKVQRTNSTEENYASEIVTEPIPMAVPYTPPYTVQYPIQYRVPSYSRQPVQEPIPIEPTSMTPIAYSDHSPHYIEPPYTIPYTVYPHPQYYYQN